MKMNEYDISNIKKDINIIFVTFKMNEYDICHIENE